MRTIEEGDNGPVDEVQSVGEVSNVDHDISSKGLHLFINPIG